MTKGQRLYRRRQREPVETDDTRLNMADGTKDPETPTINKE